MEAVVRVGINCSCFHLFLTCHRAVENAYVETASSGRAMQRSSIEIAVPTLKEAGVSATTDAKLWPIPTNMVFEGAINWRRPNISFQCKYGLLEKGGTQPPAETIEACV